MAGISRINITDVVSGRGAWRFIESQRMQPVANKIYRQVWGDNLCDGDEMIDTSLQDYAAGYDKDLGIDVFLKFKSGHQMTLQEKFLSTTFDTITVEYMQDAANNIPGDWFNLRINYYFVGYYDKNVDSPEFRTWALVDWAALQRATSMGQIQWDERVNQRDGARASFRYVRFCDLPDSVVIAGKFAKQQRQLTFADGSTYPF